MAHSRIFQVGSSPIKEDERLFAADFDSEDLGNEIDGFDYAAEPESSREEDLEWLRDALQKIGFSLNGEEITVGRNKSFIQEWREEAVRAAEKLDLWKMQKISNGLYFSSFYIYDEYYGYPVPLWKWAKDVMEERGEIEEFYVGGIIDYHF